MDSERLICSLGFNNYSNIPLKPGIGHSTVLFLRNIDALQMSVWNPLSTSVTIRRHWLSKPKKRIPEEVDTNVQQKLTRSLRRKARKFADVRESVRIEGVFKVRKNNDKGIKQRK